jgi:hypothetical protein
VAVRYEDEIRLKTPPNDDIIHDRRWRSEWQYLHQ